MRAFFSLKVVLFISGQQHSLPCTLFLESSHHFQESLLLKKVKVMPKKLKLDCWGVERAKLLKCPVRWCWNLYHCSKNMFVLNFLLPETVIYYLLTLVNVNFFALLINPGVMSGLRWLLSISPKRVSSLSTRMKYSAPSFVQILESCVLCHYFEISCRQTLKKCTKAYRSNLQLFTFLFTMYIYHKRQTCFA